MKRRLLIVASCAAAIVIIALILYGCTNNSVGPTTPIPSSNIQTGATTQLISQTVSSTAGGIFTISKVGDPLNGMTVVVPDTAYPEDRTFTVSSAPINGHNFGAMFNPVSPLITVSNGGGYSTVPMTMRIPINITSDKFAMIFMYNNQTGELEAMPMLSSDTGSVTGVTMHFSQSALAGAAHYAGKSRGMIQSQTNDNLSFVVTAVTKTLLAASTQTGFTPGTDDWEFRNYGSTIEPDGQCAGQSISMMWYYEEQKLKNSAPALWGRYNINGLSHGVKPGAWQADTLGYKFCSMVQHVLDFDSYDRKVQLLLQNMSPTVSFYEFQYAFLLQKQPQYVRLHGSGGGHAIVAYGFSGGNLNVADPNYPGIANTIVCSNGVLQPYTSAENANANGTIYPTVQFLGTSALIDQSQLNDLWAQMQNGTIGNGTFPDYDLLALDSTGVYVNLHDGFTISDSMLYVSCRNKKLMVANIYDESQNVMSSQSMGLNGMQLLLPAGTHRLGFYMTDKSNNWAGYREYTITVEENTKVDTNRYISWNGLGESHTINGSDIAPNESIGFTYDSSGGYMYIYGGVTDNGKVASAIGIVMVHIKGPGTYIITGRDVSQSAWIQNDTASFSTYMAGDPNAPTTGGTITISALKLNKDESANITGSFDFTGAIYVDYATGYVTQHVTGTFNGLFSP